MRRLRFLISFSLAVVGTFYSRAAAPVSLPRVLLLPAYDITPDAKNMLAPRQAVVRHRLQFELLSRNFSVVSEKVAVAAAATAPAISVDDPASLSDDALDNLGQRAGVDWVVKSVITHVEAHTNAAGSLSIQSRVHLQMRDVRRHDWILNRIYTDDTDAGGSPVMDFLRSLDAAVKIPLTETLKEFPATVQLDGENSLRDYL